MADPVSAGIMAGGSLLSGIIGGKGASSAAKAQAQAQQQALAQQQGQFAQTQANEQPFLSAGTNALTGSNGLLSLLGLSGGQAGTTDWAKYVQSQPDLAAEWQRVQSDPRFNGDINKYGQFHYDTYGQSEGRDLTPYTSTATTANDAQGAAIANLKNSPLFTSQYNTGQDTILQNAAATGGLRGGNTQNSLAQFGSGLLGSVYSSQLQNLMSLAGVGSNAAGTLASAGQANANAQTGIYGNLGNANATAAAAPYAGLASGISGASGGLASLLKSATGGGSINMSSMLGNTNSAINSWSAANPIGF